MQCFGTRQTGPAQGACNGDSGGPLQVFMENMLPHSYLPDSEKIFLIVDQLSVILMENGTSLVLSRLEHRSATRKSRQFMEKCTTLLFMISLRPRLINTAKISFILIKNINTTCFV